MCREVREWNHTVCNGNYVICILSICHRIGKHTTVGFSTDTTAVSVFIAGRSSDESNINHFSIYCKYADTLSLFLIDLAHNFFCENNVFLFWCVNVMYDIDLTRVDNGFSVKSHQVDHLNILTETFHVVKICINSIETLNACCSCSDNEVLSCTHQLKSCTCDMCLEVFCIITA